MPDSVQIDSVQSDSVQIDLRPPIFWVTLGRPQLRNAVDGPTAAALAEAFRRFEAEDAASVAILRGAGPHFCAGADLKAVASGQGPNRVEFTGDGPMGPTRMVCSKPVLAAISGYCVAGGLELALWCDLRVADASAVLGVFCRRFGVPLIDGGSVRLPRLIGMSRALDLILTGRPVDAEEALQMGLVNRVVPVGELEREVEALALQLASFPQRCLRNDRLSAYRQWNQDLGEALAGELALGIETLRSGEAKLGAQSFEAGRGRHGSFAGESNDERGEHEARDERGDRAEDDDL